jgi:hypothetical protein
VNAQMPDLNTQLQPHFKTFEAAMDGLPDIVRYGNADTEFNDIQTQLTNDSSVDQLQTVF